MLLQHILFDGKIFGAPWRAKYLTVEEDVLQKHQKKISEYILGLEASDSFRESMGLYYAAA